MAERVSGERIISEFATDPEMGELVELFVSELPDRIAAIRNAVASDRASDLMRLAHQLKGAAAGYGFPTLGIAAGTIEYLIRSGPPSNVSSLSELTTQVNALIDLCERAYQPE